MNPRTRRTKTRKVLQFGTKRLTLKAIAFPPSEEPDGDPMVIDAHFTPGGEAAVGEVINLSGQHTRKKVVHDSLQLIRLATRAVSEGKVIAFLDPDEGNFSILRMECLERARPKVAPKK